MQAAVPIVGPQELQLDVKWINLEELYCGSKADMADEVNTDELLELESEQEKSQNIQGLLKPCRNPIQDFFLELLAKLWAHSSPAPHLSRTGPRLYPLTLPHL